jgi:hypothetical protein
LRCWNWTGATHWQCIAAEKGDADALAFFEHLWDSYRDTGTGLACFLCDVEAGFPPHTEIVGAPDDASKVVAAPLWRRR